MINILGADDDKKCHGEVMDLKNVQQMLKSETTSDVSDDEKSGEDICLSVCTLYSVRKYVW